jgi:hypothetical protein
MVRLAKPILRPTGRSPSASQRADGRRNPVGVLKSKIGIDFRERRDLAAGSEDREHLSCDLLMIHWRGASAAGLWIFRRPRAMSDAPAKSSAKALRVQSAIGERDEGRVRVHELVAVCDRAYRLRISANAASARARATAWSTIGFG